MIVQKPSSYWGTHYGLWISGLDLLLRQQKAKQLEEVEAGLSIGREGMGCYPLVSCSIAIMWVKLCYKSPMTGNGNHTTYKNGDS